MIARPATPASFDFELGSLLESPCKRCHLKPYLPDCADSCEILDGIQKTLAGTISSVKNFSPCESYTLLINE